MTLRNDPKFARFVRRRERLNERLDASRAQFDAWIEEHMAGGDPSIVALATLEVLLKTRRDALAELVALDDELMLHLIELRSASPPPD